MVKSNFQIDTGWGLRLQLYGTYWSDHTLKLLEITGDYRRLLWITRDY